MDDRIGERIRDARSMLGLSQEKLAQLVEVDQSSIALWEKGKTKPRPEKVNDLARVLGLTPTFLSFGESPSEGAFGAVPLFAAVTDHDVVKEFPKRSIQKIIRPPGAADEIADRAIIVHGTSQWPVHSPGDILFVNMSANLTPETVIQRECVVKLKGGALVLKRILKGTDGRFTLVSAREPEMVDQEVEAAYPIQWVMKAK